MKDIDELRKAHDDMLWEKYHRDGGRCEECGSSDGEDILICEGSGEETWEEKCLTCKEECCCLRSHRFKCSNCGHVTKED